MNIKEVDNIVAIEILKSTYKIDVTIYSKEELEKIIELLQIAFEATVLDQTIDTEVKAKKTYDDTILTK